MQDKPQTARFGMTLFLDNPLHRQAWEILSAIPAGQRTNWLCLALCQQAQREQFLLDLKTILVPAGYLFLMLFTYCSLGNTRFPPCFYDSSRFTICPASRS